MSARASKQPYWIKERDNPQLGTYYVACGQMSMREAAKHVGSLYGTNTMLRFDTEEAYTSKLAALRASGERVQ